MKIKKIAYLALAVIMSIGMVACSNKDAGNNSKEIENKSEVSGDKIELKFAHVVRPTTPKGEAVEKFKELIEERTGGKVEVTIYPDSQMGSDQEINEMILDGTIDMNTPLFSTLTSFVPEFELFDLPYLFHTEEEAYNALTGEVGKQLDEHLKEAGLVSLGYQTGGFKQLTNSVRPINSVADMDGLKIRVSQSKILVEQFKSLNAGGVSVPFPELYAALQNKTVDGQENPFSNIATRKFYEVQDYLTISNHGLMGYAFIMNKDKFESLPEDIQKTLKEIAAEVNEWEWKRNKEMDAEYIEEIKGHGMELTEFGEKEKEEYKEKASSVYDTFSEMESGKKLLELVKPYTENGNE